MTRRARRLRRARKRWAAKRPRRLHLHDQRRQGARAGGGAGTAGAAPLTSGRCAPTSSRSASPCSRPNGRMGQAIAAAVAAGSRLRHRPGSWRRAGRFLRPGGAAAEPRPRHCRRRADPDRHHRPRRSRRASASPRRPRQVAVLRAANTSLGVALLSDLVERAARVLGPGLGHRNRRNAPPPQGRRAVGHRACAGRSRGARPRQRRSRPSAAATAPASSARKARSASPRCAAARSPAIMTSSSPAPRSG